jgi:hypothetical protein
VLQSVHEVLFEGPKTNKPVLSPAKTVVETYQQPGGEELGESVGFDVEIVCAYVMRGEC